MSTVGYFYWARALKGDPSPVKLDADLRKDLDDEAIIPGSKQVLDESTWPLSLDQLARIYPRPRDSA